MKLQIGMKVRIKSDTKNYPFNAGKVKTITSHLPDFGTKRAFGLDGDDGIWCIEDFSEFISYPNKKME